MNKPNPFYDEVLGDLDPTLGEGRKETAFDRIKSTAGVDVEPWFHELRKAGEDLLEARMKIAALKAENARLESRYGGSGAMPSHWDHERKRLLAELDTDFRMRAAAEEEAYAALSKEEQQGRAKPQKITEGAVDAYTHQHPRYKQFLEEAGRDREAYLKYRAEIDALYAKVEHFQGVREYIIQRLRINEEAVRHDRSLANLGG